MPNSVVQIHRQQFANDPRTDDEISVEYAQTYGLQALSHFPDFVDDLKRIDLQARKLSAPGLGNEFTQAFGSGVDLAQAKLYDTAALVGDIVGSKAITDFGEAGYKRNLEESARNAPTIRSLEEIESPGDAVRYAVGLAGQQAPQLLGTAAGSLAGAAIGAPFGAPLLGAGIGGGAVGFSQMQNRGELKSTPGAENIVPTALGVGAIGAALETLPVVKALGKIAPKLFGKIAAEVGEESAHKVGEAYLHRALQEIPQQALLEGGTEVAQEVVSIAGEMFANRDNPNFQIDPEAVRSRLINSGVAGALLGGGVGAVEAIPGPARPGFKNEAANQIEGEQGQQTANPAPVEPLVPGAEGEDPRVAAIRSAVVNQL